METGHLSAGQFFFLLCSQHCLQCSDGKRRITQVMDEEEFEPKKPGAHSPVTEEI